MAKSSLKTGLVTKSVRDEIARALHDEVKTKHIKNDSNMAPKFATSTMPCYGHQLGSLKLSSFNVPQGLSNPDTEARRTRTCFSRGNRTL